MGLNPPLANRPSDDSALGGSGAQAGVGRHPLLNPACCMPSITNCLPRSSQVEVDLTLKREGRGLRCDLHQLNGVLRLREE